MSTSSLEPRSFIPQAQHEEEIAQLAQFLRTERKTSLTESSYLVTPSGQRQEIPAEIFDLLTFVVETLSEGKGLTVMPTYAQLTTQQAADHLGISCPTLVKLLEQGEISFIKVGRHRRVTLEDVVAYEQSSRQSRREALRELTEQASADGTYFQHPESTETR